MAELKLRNCPFCGNKIAPTIMTIAEIECDDSDEWARTHYAVVCNHNHVDTIGCGASTGYYANSPEEAADIWNRRYDNG